MKPEMKVDYQRLGSRYQDGTLMYPGVSALTWVKLPYMPWVLINIESVGP